MYHHVCRAVASGPYARALTVTPDEFAAQLRWLQARGCQAVTLDKVVSDAASGTGSDQRRKPDCEVALTFDDGYSDAAQFAAPLLRSFGDVGTFFVMSAYIDRPGHLRAGQIRTLASEGMEIGAHTIDHPDLTLLQGPRLAQEIGLPQSALSRLSGSSITAFAYPSGRLDGRVEAVVRAAGYRVAVTTVPRRLGTGPGVGDRLALPRFRILRGRGMGLFAKVLGKLRPAPAEASPLRVKNVARRRIEGNDAKAAEAIAVDLLDREYPEQILKVRVLKVPPVSVAGIMLSGVKFHHRLGVGVFLGDVRAMIAGAFASEPGLREVDVWAVVPVATAPDSTVSGDYAVPTNRTVFSTTARAPSEELGKTYWDTQWADKLAKSGLP